MYLLLCWSGAVKSLTSMICNVYLSWHTLTGMPELRSENPISCGLASVTQIHDVLMPAKL